MNYNATNTQNAPRTTDVLWDRRVIIDSTAIIKRGYFSRFFENFLHVFSENNRKLLMPEGKFIFSDNDPKMNEKRDFHKKSVEFLSENGYLEHIGIEELTQSQNILSYIIANRHRERFTVITQNSKLAHDLKLLNGLQSCRGNAVEVYRLEEDGTLGLFVDNYNVKERETLL